MNTIRYRKLMEEEKAQISPKGENDRWQGGEPLKNNSERSAGVRTSSGGVCAKAGKIDH